MGSFAKVTTNNTTMDSGSKFIFFLCIVAFPTAILGLQCYSTTVSLTEGLTPTLKNCSENTLACQITSNGTYTGQSCSPIKLYTGCVTLQGISSCFCTTDGCNESVAKAGVPQQIGSLVSLILSLMMSVIW